MSHVYVQLLIYLSVGLISEMCHNGFWKSPPFQTIHCAIWRNILPKLCARVCVVCCMCNLIVGEKLLVSPKWFQKGEERQDSLGAR